MSCMAVEQDGICYISMMGEGREYFYAMNTAVSRLYACVSMVCMRHRKSHPNRYGGHASANAPGPQSFTVLKMQALWLS